VGTNRYAYSHNDPVNKSDENGHELVTVGAIAVAGFYAASNFALGYLMDQAIQHSAIESGLQTAAVSKGSSFVAGMVSAGLAFVPGGVLYGKEVGFVLSASTRGVVGTAAARGVHGNSLQSQKPQHTYTIEDTKTGTTFKAGVSGETLNKNGTSPRGNKQANKLNRSTDEDGRFVGRVHESGIRGSNGKTARERGLEAESKLRDGLREKGEALPGNNERGSNTGGGGFSRGGHDGPEF
jgi:hypothetical protein